MYMHTYVRIYISTVPVCVLAVRAVCKLGAVAHCRREWPRHGGGAWRRTQRVRAFARQVCCVKRIQSIVRIPRIHSLLDRVILSFGGVA